MDWTFEHLLLAFLVTQGEEPLACMLTLDRTERLETRGSVHSAACLGWKPFVRYNWTFSNPAAAPMHVPKSHISCRDGEFSPNTWARCERIYGTLVLGARSPLFVTDPQVYELELKRKIRLGCPGELHISGLRLQTTLSMGTGPLSDGCCSSRRAGFSKRPNHYLLFHS